jgi:23S rRNA (guanine2445-N2)-methyltransferase / 23S rRNA (guanine2069-N7)-methyltransferase
MKTQPWFASCPRGLESLLLEELRQLGAENLRETVAGCGFEATLAVAYRAALWSRLANRILLLLAERLPVDADPHPALVELPWETWLPAGCSFVVDFSGSNRAVRNTQFGAQRVKDAIVDRFRSRSLPRPSVSRKQPDLRFQARLHRGHITVSLDFAGASLHQRGYRQQAGMAPLKENLAAAMLLRADWPGIASRGGALIDPLCGAGTLLIEGAMMAADMAPGLGRRHWSFEKLPQHNPDQWRAIHRDAESRAERGRSAQLPEIRGYDANRQVVDKALANIRRAGLEGQVRVICKPLKALKRPTHKLLDHGLIISNPPYGERLGEARALRELYRDWGDILLREFPGWQAAMLTSDKELGMATGLRSRKRYALYNGALACSLLLFELDPEHRLKPRPAPAASEGATMFANRLGKNRAKVERWARREGHSCYRLYDADMPEYAVAIDRYGDCLHVAEYKAPKGIDPDAAQRRAEEIRGVLPGVFDMPEDKIFYKLRQRQAGRSQYQRSDQRGEFQEVTEGGVKLLVNLSAYLDTGLFLDHRPLRLRIAAEASGKDFLNLFCYTASASVHAAAGGARSTTGVDLSNTYLDWGRRNLALNGFEEPSHRLLRADCREWLERDSGLYDLMFVDPPSFSNSKRMEGHFDVQRDHVALLENCLERLRPGGALYFSNNLKGFRLDPVVAERWSVEDITPATIDFDFRRTPRIHRCWRIVGE